MKQFYLKDNHVISVDLPEGLEPILLTNDLFKKMNWKDENEGWHSDNQFSKNVNGVYVQIRQIDSDDYWHLSSVSPWIIKMKYLHELQFLWHLIFKTDLEV